jgi:hypothetical protein
MGQDGRRHAVPRDIAVEIRVSIGIITTTSLGRPARAMATAMAIWE